MTGETSPGEYIRIRLQPGVSYPAFRKIGELASAMGCSVEYGNDTQAATTEQEREPVYATVDNFIEAAQELYPDRDRYAASAFAMKSWNPLQREFIKAHNGGWSPIVHFNKHPPEHTQWDFNKTIVDELDVRSLEKYVAGIDTLLERRTESSAQIVYERYMPRTTGKTNLALWRLVVEKLLPPEEETADDQS